MKLLVLASDYPKPGRLFGEIFNERSVAALKELCDGVEVLAPRPYAPRLLSSVVPRWRLHASTRAYEIRNGVPVYRPAVPVVPRTGPHFGSIKELLFGAAKRREQHTGAQSSTRSCGST